MTKLTKKQRHQVKSRWYYLFWGAATVSVFAGQIYVGSGYRRMSKSFDRIINTVLFELEKEITPRHPMIVPIDPEPLFEYHSDFFPPDISHGSLWNR